MTLRDLLRKPYNKFVREHLPRKIGVYNGVAVRFPRFLDFDDHTQNWKKGTVGRVKDAVREGDRVLEVGSGFGVCTVWAARQAGTDGGVVTYEASADRYAILKETLELNEVSDRVRTHHALVGENVDVFGPLADANQIPPRDLPDADVFITDCEGAELDLLTELFEEDELRPRSLVIETHGFAGSSTEAVVNCLRKQDYEIIGIQQASPHGNREDDNQVVLAEDV